jgi:predicted CoA-substrate-specific enzyme activase
MPHTASRNVGNTAQPIIKEIDHSDQSSVHIGFDVGSIAVKMAILDKSGRLIEQFYQRHLGKPVQVAYDLLEEILHRYSARQIATFAGTGTAGRFICKLMNARFVNELSCQAAAVRHLIPHARTVIEMGGQDSKLIFLSADQKDTSGIEDFAMNTACAAGTGSFLDQQASRLGLNIENEFGQLALKSEIPPRVAGRCSVFAKSDMIHLQQQATPVHDIVAGLCFGLARNLRSNLGRGKDFTPPVVFCGGVAYNQGVVRALQEVLEIDNNDNFIVPQNHAVTGAMGAALIARRNWDGKSCTDIDLKPIREYLDSQQTIGHRLAKLQRPKDGYPDMRTAAEEIFAEVKNNEKVPVYLGIDVGSISTNVVAIDKKCRVLAKSYLMTAGRPLEAVRQGLTEVGKLIADKVEVVGVATTGSGRYLTGDFVGADTVVNEITAQATAAAHIDPKVDTIFEIGGQDSKYISLENGVVTDFEMNHACAAGTGSFLEEQAERLGINIKTQFSDMALGAPDPIRLGERCTVFMESDLVNYQQQGAPTNELVAGLCYSIVTNYLNRVVGHRKIGNRIFFQGGTAFNKGVVAAFEAVTGKTITVPPHHEVTGAIGVAILAKRYMDQQPPETKSKFRGFDVTQRKYEIRSFECTHCSNNCEINEVIMDGSDPLYYGSRCDRYNVKKTNDSDKNKIPNLFAERQRLLEQYANVSRKPTGKKKTVGIPMALGNYQLLPLWGTFFTELGFEPIVSSATTQNLVERGVEAVLSQPCFPVKVAHGHVLDLLDKKVDFIWLPSVISLNREEPRINNMLCPYVQTIPYQINIALEPEKHGVKLLKPFLRFQDGLKELEKNLSVIAADLGVSKGEIRSALKTALRAQDSFQSACIKRGKEILSHLKDSDQAMVLISRPYNGCDPGVSLDIPGKLRKLGMLTIPMDFLDLSGIRSNARYQEKDGMYWKYGQKIMKACKFVRNDSRLHAIYLSNFSCGPDSFITQFFKDIMNPKPCLMLEIDEHSADAGVVTRLEAFLESLKNAGKIKVTPIKEEELAIRKHDCSQRTIYIPWMNDHSYALAAAFRACGQPSEVLPLADQRALELGRRYTTGKECLPCIITTGDMLKKLESPDCDPKKAAFFMPGGSGPCRFGQYNCLHRQVLEEIGYKDVPVISPSQDKSFYDDFKQFKTDPTRLAWNGIAAIDILLKVQLALRPYEITKGEIDAVYQNFLTRICRAIEQKASESQLVKIMEDAAVEFGRVKLDRSQQKPHICIVGEIYVRNHTVSNDFLIKRLEALGAQCSLSGFAEWMYYTNFTRKRSSLREREWGSFAVNWLKHWIQNRIEMKLYKPLLKLVPELQEPPVEHALNLANPYIHDSFEGEAALSVGKMIEFASHGADGLISAGPFTCMPTTIVSAVMKKLTTDLNGIPAITLSFDGQGDPTLDTRLEAFVDQARAFKNRKNHHAMERTPAQQGV